MATSIATIFHTKSRMHRILRPRRPHFERAAGLSRELRPATGGSSSFDMMLSPFVSEHQTGLSGVTLSETGSGKAPPSHRDRPLTRGDPYPAAPPSRPLPEDDAAAPVRRRDHTSLQAPLDAASTWCLPGRPPHLDQSSLSVKRCSLRANTRSAHRCCPVPVGERPFPRRRPPVSGEPSPPKLPRAP